MNALLQVREFTGHGGLRLVADVGGDPGKPSVLLMHGAGQTRHSWRLAANELVRRGYHVISLDHRGHGDSEWSTTGDYSLEAFMGDVHAIAASVSQPLTLIGASLGGAISLLVTGREANQVSPPLSVAALILVDVVPRLAPGGIARIRGFMDAQPQGFSSLQEAADAIAHYMPHRPRPASLEGLRKNLRLKPDGRWYWHWDPNYARFRTGASTFTDQLELAAQRVNVPTLIVRGARSELVDEAGVQLLRQMIPHAQAVDVQGAHHMVAGDRNDAFNQVIHDFLVRHAGTGASA
jgi:non-heme chloroperoxidase